MVDLAVLRREDAMRKPLQVLIVLIGIVVGLTGCDQLMFGISLFHPSGDQTISPDTTQEPSVSHGAPVTDYVSLVDNLRASGAEVEPVGEITQPFFTVTGQTIRIKGADIQVFEFPNEAEAAVDASVISPDGGSTGTTMITWVASPHFYRAGKIIVLYVGDDSSITALLTSLLGSQFAGR